MYCYPGVCIILGYTVILWFVCCWVILHPVVCVLLGFTVILWFVYSWVDHTFILWFAFCWVVLLSCRLYIARIYCYHVVWFVYCWVILLSCSLYIAGLYCYPVVCILLGYTWLLTFLDTWSGFEAAIRLLHGRVGDSTTSVNSLSPQMSELVEDAIASWYGDIVEDFWLIGNELQKLEEFKFQFFTFHTFDVSQIFWQWVVQPNPKYSYCILLKGLCWVSDCWILNNTLCSMSWMFSGFYCVPHCAINIWHHMLCYLPNICNYITFTPSLERVQFEFVQSFPVV